MNNCCLSVTFLLHSCYIPFQLNKSPILSPFSRIVVDTEHICTIIYIEIIFPAIRISIEINYFHATFIKNYFVLHLYYKMYWYFWREKQMCWSGQSFFFFFSLPNFLSACKSCHYQLTLVVIHYNSEMIFIHSFSKNVLFVYFIIRELLLAFFFLFCFKFSSGGNMKSKKKTEKKLLSLSITPLFSSCIK